MKGCCKGFEIFVSNAGEKGISIVSRRLTERRFYLQARVFDMGQEPINVPELHDCNANLIPLTTVMSAVIHYCPSCGSNLTTLINNDFKSFDILLEKQKHLWEG